MKNPFKKSPRAVNQFEDSVNQAAKKEKKFLGKFSKKHRTPLQDNGFGDIATDHPTEQPTDPMSKPHDMQTQGFEYEDMAATDTAINTVSDASSTADPYAAPTAMTQSMASTPNQYHLQPWYALDGRIGRIKLLAYGAIFGIILLVIVLIATVILGGTTALMFGMATGEFGMLGLLPLLMLLLTLPVLVYTYIILPRRRLHDIGQSGWWSLLWLVPIGNLYLLYLLYLKAGDEGINEYGLPDAPNSTLEKGLAGLAIVGFILSFLLPFLLPLFMSATMMDTDLSEQVILEEVSDPAFDESFDEQFDESVMGDETVITPDTDPMTDSIDDGRDDGMNDSIDDIDAMIEVDSVDSVDSTDGLDEDEANMANNELVAPMSPDPVNTANNPEVQAAIDAALGADTADDATSATPSGGISYEQFKQLAETTIVIADDDDNSSNIPNNPPTEVAPE